MPNPLIDRPGCEQMPEMEQGPEREHPEESPPLFSSWKKWYAVVLLHLAFLIVIYYLFTKAFE